MSCADACVVPTALLFGALVVVLGVGFLAGVLYGRLT
jgi:hypothetical protein